MRTTTSPLRRRMMEDMRVRGIGDAQRSSHIRGVALFAAFLGRSPDTATAEDLRAWQLRVLSEPRARH
jgi:hypothetical protein